MPPPAASTTVDCGFLLWNAIGPFSSVLRATFRVPSLAVRESLRSGVFPLVPRCQRYFQAWRNREGVYDFYADDWVLPEWAKKGDDSSHSAGHPSLSSARRFLKS